MDVGFPGEAVIPNADNQPPPGHLPLIQTENKPKKKR